MAVARSRLQELKIVEEGFLAEVFTHQLPDTLRRHNVSYAEYRRLRQLFEAKDEPIAFPTRDAAEHFVAGRYEQCELALSGSVRLEQKSMIEETNTPVDSQPVEPEPAKESSRNPRTFRLDDSTVELIALDMLENPEIGVTHIAKRWNVSQPTISRIREAKHTRLQDRTYALLRIVFNGDHINKHEWLVPDYKINPQSFPVAAREQLEKYMSKGTAKPPKPARTQPRAIENKSDPAPAPVQETEPVKEEPAQQMMPGQAPASMAQAMVVVGGQEHSLKEVLLAAQKIMRAQGIMHIGLPQEGNPTVQWQGVLLL